MWKVFKAEEVVDFAVQIEKNGQKFYEALADKLDNRELSLIFADLANQESKHIVDFQRLLGDLKAAPLNESYPGEYEEYVKGLAENHVFIKGIDEAIKHIKSPVDGINMALSFEKDSIMFFQELKELVSPGNAGVINNLIAEEKKHILRLIELKKMYSCVCFG
ncbi:ferritin-like domain-containing protein [Desulfitibacter alkalitolerans]|uniref:ferritin-like domain-containing protein n=1 Tax=Desulfitibacter alkalitolerans TaxID=264641 RepID=UPI00054D4871|nr:ferritin family protein [Desulfitibacter alkalitolerans]